MAIVTFADMPDNFRLQQVFNANHGPFTFNPFTHPSYYTDRATTRNADGSDVNYVYFSDSSPAPAAPAFAFYAIRIGLIASPSFYWLVDNSFTLVQTANLAALHEGGAATAALLMAGNDQVTGSSNANYLEGFAGNDVLDGAGGNDILNGGSGRDTLKGGDGLDTYYADVSNEIISETNANILTGGNDLVIYSGAGAFILGANVERLTLSGTAISHAFGNGLANTITGNIAANRITGLAGKDTLTGGLGNDKFVYKAAADSRGTTKDVIKDFDDLGNDRIDLSAVFAGTLTYRGLGALTGLNQVHIKDIAGPSVLVEVNLTGSLAPDLSIRLNATAAASMTASDFIL